MEPPHVGCYEWGCWGLRPWSLTRLAEWASGFVQFQFGVELLGEIGLSGGPCQFDGPRNALNGVVESSGFRAGRGERMENQWIPAVGQSVHLIGQFQRFAAVAQRGLRRCRQQPGQIDL